MVTRALLLLCYGGIYKTGSEVSWSGSTLANKRLVLAWLAVYLPETSNGYILACHYPIFIFT